MTRTREVELLIVIVNYRSADLTMRCLQSLEAELVGFERARVVVVDNRSEDGSLEKLEQLVATRGWSGWVEVCAAAVNGGFSYGNNWAIRPALAAETPPEFIWLLNPDTEVRPGALSALLDFMDAHPRAGIAGSGFENADGSRWPYAFRFPSLLSEVDQHLRLGVVTRLLSRFTVARTMPEHAERVDWLAGASMMIRRSVFDAVGLMDEGYFLYFEETDFCLEAARAGFETWYVPKSRVMHVMGQSTGVTGHHDEPKRLPGYWFESRSRYFVKNHGRLYGVVTDVLSLACFAAWRLRRIVQRKPDRDPPHFFGDLWRHSAMFRSSLPTNPRVGA